MVTKDAPKRLRRERTERGWSQAELARRSGIRQSHLSTYENGHVFPDHRNIRRLANAFQVPEAEVFGWLREGQEDAA